MVLVLQIMALLLLFMYFVYFMRILKGDSQSLELLIIKSLAEWMIKNGPSSRLKLWILMGLSIVLEVAYFYLALVVIVNPALEVLTSFFAGVEFYHMFTMVLRFRMFFRGRLMISQVFDWRIERISAVFFFTHALLVLISFNLFKIY